MSDQVKASIQLEGARGSEAYKTTGNIIVKASLSPSDLHFTTEHLQADITISPTGTTLEASPRSRVAVVEPKQLQEHDRFVLGGRLWTPTAPPIVTDQEVRVYAYCVSDNPQPECLVVFAKGETVIVLLAAGREL